MIKINRELIEQGYISERKHPSQAYFIYNYTAKTQYDRVWTKDTLNCRGLILDGHGNIIARPFEKFFNLEEYEYNSHLGMLPPFKRFDVYEKLDGSLGILYHLPNGEPRIATRGSFESEQAKVATEILKEKYSHIHFKRGLTFLFEIIYPQNRIVIDYGNKRDLVLLAVRNTETGEDWSHEALEDFCQQTRLPLVQRYGMRCILSQVKNIQQENREGYVIQFNTGLRVKVKFAEYVRLHKILTGVSTKTIWELLRNNQPIDQIIEKVPDEFYSWFMDQVDELKRKHYLIEVVSKTLISILPTLTEAKECGILSETAKKIQKHKYHSVVFAMWRGKPYKDIIWKMIRPEYKKPFKTEQ